jgi:hypothetical protein
MSVSIFYIFRPGIDSQFVKSNIIVSKCSLKISHFLDELISSAFKFVIKLLFFIGGFSFLA